MNTIANNICLDYERAPGNARYERIQIGLLRLHKKHFCAVLLPCTVCTFPWKLNVGDGDGDRAGCRLSLCMCGVGDNGGAEGGGKVMTDHQILSLRWLRQMHYCQSRHIVIGSLMRQMDYSRPY